MVIYFFNFMFYLFCLIFIWVVLCVGFYVLLFELSLSLFCEWDG